ncbi:MAG: hypothetical protein IPG01_16780 [Chitinophagaceae bacterium]|nr:hypothetical protein [Chitinophagaceae bacterium]
MKKSDKELLRPFFWDTDIDKVTLEKAGSQLLNGYLKYGHMSDIRKELLAHYSDDDIIDIVKRSSNL